MEILIKIALFFHLIGFASLFGVSAVQVRQPVRIARNGMLHGALTQLVSGLILMTTLEDINQMAAGIKFLILLGILGILFYYRRDEKREIPATPFFVVFGLTFVEVLIAILFVGE